MSTTTIISNTEFDNNAYEAMYMQAEIMDEIVSFANDVYGDSAVERIVYGDLEFTTRVCNEYWDSVLI